MQTKGRRQFPGHEDPVILASQTACELITVSLGAIFDVFAIVRSWFCFCFLSWLLMTKCKCFLSFWYLVVIPYVIHSTMVCKGYLPLYSCYGDIDFTVPPFFFFLPFCSFNHLKSIGVPLYSTFKFYGIGQMCVVKFLNIEFLCV